MAEKKSSGVAASEAKKSTKTVAASNGKAAQAKKIGIKPAHILGLSPEEILQDYRVAFRSRQTSLLGRREVLTGKAKFGIFGDGKEVPQMAMARVFRKGDFRSGYYRDQTFMFALGISNVREFFAQLYAHTDVQAEPSSAGRSMNGHFGTRSLNPDGSWKNLTEMYNSSADVSPTGSQMPRLVGLAYASRLYRELPDLHQFTQFSNKGNEIAFGTIGNASSAEGMFWEAVNAIGVLKSPAIISLWDDGYGISVPGKYQITKDNLGEVLSGFRRNDGGESGYELFVVKAWDYAALMETYQKAEKIAREEHIPVLIHVIEVTQPQGHSTSGSHERYKSKERLQWEADFDCVAKMREWIVSQNIADEKALVALEEDETRFVQEEKQAAWNAYIEPIRTEIAEVTGILNELFAQTGNAEIHTLAVNLTAIREPFRRDIMVAIHRALLATRTDSASAKQALIEWKKNADRANADRYNSYLHTETADSALKIPEIKAKYSEQSPSVNGSEVMNACFDSALARNPRIIAFGEDLGFLGDVNQGFAGLQAKYGELRVSDTGIRECTILGQAIGMAMRGLRPIAEIQYLDYLLYALQLMSDDLATVQWRTKGGQKAPVIIRTRGHRLEGIWHSGSPMAGILNLVRGIHVCVPRNMTQAAGMYNLLLQAEEPALIIEVLNGYRLKEKLPDNVGEFTVPLGVPEILREGTDMTLVTYGPMCRLSLEAAELLERVGISVEIIDVQTLLPFDNGHKIVESLKKTNRLLVADEDVPGGASAYILQKIVEEQNGYRWLDSAPKTVAAQAHRPAYGTDGNYWSKADVEHVFEAVYDMMHEANPGKYPMYYR